MFLMRLSRWIVPNVSKNHGRCAAVAGGVLLLAAPARLNALPAYPEFGESLVFQFNGLVVVFLALGLIWGLMEALGFVFRRIAARDAARALLAPPPVVATPATPPDPAPVPTIDPVILAVVAAAVHRTVGAPHRIVGVTALTDAVDWSREGRRDHFQTHRIR